MPGRVSAVSKPVRLSEGTGHVLGSAEGGLGSPQGKGQRAQAFPATATRGCCPPVRRALGSTGLSFSSLAFAEAQCWSSFPP